MDGIGEIIYIIIMVVIFIFSALKRKKPERNDMPVPEDEDQESRKPFDEVFSPFKEIFEEEDPVPQKSPQQPVSEEQPVPPGKLIRDLKDAPFVREDYVFTANTSPADARRQRKNRAPGRQEKLKSEELNALKIEEDERVVNHDWFKLREAVIFSEILKRPDY